MLVAGSYDGKGEGMTEQDIMEVISEVNQRVANVEKRTYSGAGDVSPCNQASDQTYRAAW